MQNLYFWLGLAVIVIGFGGALYVAHRQEERDRRNPHH